MPPTGGITIPITISANDVPHSAELVQIIMNHLSPAQVLSAAVAAYQANQEQ